MTHPYVAAVTGSIGSGKSQVAEIFRQLGSPVIDADMLAREAVLPGTEALSKISAKFGPSVLEPSGDLDRRALGEIVFRDSAKRAELEAIVHPEVRRLFVQHLGSIDSSNHAPVIYVIPLYFETKNHHPEIRKVVVVSADRETCLQRIIARDGSTRELAEKKLDAQIPIEVKEKRADYLIKNSGSLVELQKEVQEVFKKLVHDSRL